MRQLSNVHFFSGPNMKLYIYLYIYIYIYIDIRDSRGRANILTCSGAVRSIRRQRSKDKNPPPLQQPAPAAVSFIVLFFFFPFLSPTCLLCFLVLILGGTLPCLRFIPSSPFVVLRHDSLGGIVSPPPLFSPPPFSTTTRLRPPSDTYSRRNGGGEGKLALCLDGGGDRWRQRRVA